MVYLDFFVFYFQGSLVGWVGWLGWLAGWMGWLGWLAGWVGWLAGTCSRSQPASSDK